TSPVTGSITTLPPAATPGLPRDPPSASTISSRGSPSAGGFARKATAIRAPPRSQARFAGAHQDRVRVRAEQHVIGCRGAHHGHVRGVQRNTTGARHAATQVGGAHAVAGALLLIERQEVGRQARGQSIAIGAGGSLLAI